MDDLESKLGSVLSNPELMGQIMNMAKSLNLPAPQENAPKPQSPPPPPKPSMPEFDMGTLQRISGILNQTGIDREQQTLLKALHPYLQKERLQKLERAMRAARMAALASAVLNQSGFKPKPGR